MGARTLGTASREAMPMKTALGWSAKLTRTIVLKDGTRLVTLGDVRAFILKEPKASKRPPLRLKMLCFWKRGTCGYGNDV
jgi:hypothetical protein